MGSHMKRSDVTTEKIGTLLVKVWLCCKKKFVGNSTKDVRKSK